MPINYTTGNYVKFLRGTPAAYEALTPKDSDTLYFVSERNADRGLLYLGEKLISGSLTSATTIEDLQDTLISAGIEAGSLLYYDGTHWIDKTINEIFEIIIAPFMGATANEDGTTGLVPTPEAGQQNLFLKGDGTWADPFAGLSPTYSALVDQVGTLIGNDIGKSAREIAAEEVNRIVDGAPAAFDTLKEIADYLSDHEVEGDILDRIDQLESIIHNPSTGLLHRTSVVEVAIQNINTALDDLRDQDAELAADIENLQNQLNNALRWKDFELTGN